MFKSIIKLGIFVVLISCSAWAATINVPGSVDNPVTIRWAIDNASDGDTVVIAQDRYTGDGSRNITITNKAITVTSTDPTNPDVVAATVIDCENATRAFAFGAGTDGMVVKGLTIKNGAASFSGIGYGGAMSFSGGASPLISNCVFIDCNATIGGALAVENGDSSPRIWNCRMINNTASISGGALYLNGGDAEIKNCIISGNIAPRGGAVYGYNQGNPVLINCTMTDNVARDINGNLTVGGAVYCYNLNSLTLYGCILWNNVAETAAQIQVGSKGNPVTVTARYCNIQGLNAYAEGSVEHIEHIDVFAANTFDYKYNATNIDINPMFVGSTTAEKTDAAMCDQFALMEDSPCVDAGDMDYVAGDMETDVYNKQRVFGDAIDIGAAEFVIEETNTKIKLWPKAINYRDEQNLFFCRIKIENCAPEKINADSVLLYYDDVNEGIPPMSSKTYKRVEELMVRFDMQKVRAMLQDVKLKKVTLRVVGKLNDQAQTEFEGTGKLKIYRKKDKDKHHDDCKKHHKHHDKCKDDDKGKHKDDDKGKHKDDDDKKGKKKH